MDDLAAAEDLYGLGRYSKACFLSHQAVEKAAKAALVMKLRRYETIHRVAELLRRPIVGVQVLPDLIREEEVLDRLLHTHTTLTHSPTEYPTATTVVSMTGRLWTTLGRW